MPSYLEDHFPHLIPKLTGYWDKPHEFKAFISNLIFDTRGGRSGWPSEAWDELVFLEALHQSSHPADQRDEEDVLLDDSIKWVS